MTEKLFVFVLMPFDKSFNDIYNLGIKSVCKELDIYCERVDEQIFTESILDRIYNQIIKADIIIADMSGRNPNVFYETGFAHAHDKKTILLTSNADDIPFDLKHYYHIVYKGSITDLISDLKKRLLWFKENPTETSLPNTQELEYYFDGVRIQNGINIKRYRRNVEIDYLHDTNALGFVFQLDIYNPNETLVDSKQKIGIETSNFFHSDNSDSIKSIKTQNGRFFHISNFSDFDIYPKMYESIKFSFWGEWFGDSFSEDLILKIHNEIEVKEIQFKLIYDEN